MNTWMSSWVNTLCACRLELTIQRAESIKTLGKCLMRAGHQVWAISIASYLDCSKTQDSRVYGQKHLENWDFFFFFLAKLLLLLFSRVLAKPKEFIWMMETEHHHVFRTPSCIMLLESYFLLLKATCISYRNSNIFA